MYTDKIIKILKEEIALAINESIHAIDSNLAFLRLGISSIDSLKIINKVKRKLQIDIHPVAMFEYKTINDLANYLNQCMQEKEADFAEVEENF